MLARCACKKFTAALLRFCFTGAARYGKATRQHYTQHGHAYATRASPLLSDCFCLRVIRSSFIGVSAIMPYRRSFSFATTLFISVLLIAASCLCFSLRYTQRHIIRYSSMTLMFHF
jgi:hypothetical protein